MSHNYVNLMNDYGKNNIPFLFVIDFLGEKPLVIPLDEAKNESVLFYINGKANYKKQYFRNENLLLNAFPIKFSEYKKQFDLVHKAIMRGNSYLTNFTCETKIESNYNLKELFYRAQAKYKLFFRDEFIVFSPETFVKMKDNRIFSYPMKGTIDAAIPNAEKLILTNEKEKAEHYTIVDLIRNDLSKIATNVQVSKFRFIDKIVTSHGELLQVSSEISGNLPNDFAAHLGDYFHTLLPAGSISGAPKNKTIEIINQAENHNRGYYTGVFGCFDGKELDSGVMIRFIEKKNDGLVYKSGGGVTHQSNPEEEYSELIKKIYVPLY